jgi:glycosyltransferase involved in cell wall biosynthesis
VSVLLPVRDAAAFLPACTASLGRQTLGDHEVIAVDDGSSDGSPALLDAWAAGDRRVRVLHRPARGLVAALNDGLAACRGALVARMDADDVAHPRRLELQGALLARRPEVGVASCLVRHFPWTRVGEGFRVYETWLNSLVEPEEIARERFIESPVAHPSTMVRRELLEAAGGWRDEGWPEDYDLWLRLAERGVRFAKVPRYLHFWREHGGRLTRVAPRYAVERFLACKAAFLISGPLAAARLVVVWGAGQTGRRLAKHLIAGGARPAAFVDIDPAKIGRTVRGVRVVAPETLPALLGSGTVVVAAVSSRGARALIRERLAALGLHETSEFWCAA